MPGKNLWPVLAASIASILWLGGAAYLVNLNQLDWIETGLTLQLGALLLAGLGCPLIVIWLIALAFLQIHPLRQQRAALAQGLAELLNPVHIAEKRVEALTLALHQKIEDISNAADMAGEKIKALESHFEDQIKGIQDVTILAETRTSTIQKSLSDERQNLETLITEMEHRATEIRLMAENLAETLRRAAGDARAEARAAGESMAEHAAQLAMSSRETIKNLDEIGESLAGHTGKLHETSLAAEQAIARVGNSVDEQQALLTQSLESFSLQTKDLLADMSEAQTAFTSKAADSLHETGNRLKEDQDELIARYDMTLEKIRDISSTVSQQMSAMLKATTTAEARADHIGGILEKSAQNVENASSEASLAADIVNNSLTSQTEGLTRAASEIQKYADELMTLTARLETKSSTQSHSEFTKSSSFILESLASQAIDIHRVLDTNIPDEVWQKYLKGDRSIFARRTVRLGNSQTKELIARKFREDSEFREHTQRYIKEFEKLMAHAISTDPQGPLGVTLVSSEMGKLYVLLAQSLKRLS